MLASWVCFATARARPSQLHYPPYYTALCKPLNPATQDQPTQHCLPAFTHSPTLPPPPDPPAERVANRVGAKSSRVLTGQSVGSHDQPPFRPSRRCVSGPSRVSAPPPSLPALSPRLAHLAPRGAVPPTPAPQAPPPAHSPAPTIRASPTHGPARTVSIPKPPCPVSFADPRPLNHPHLSRKYPHKPAAS